MTYPRIESVMGLKGNPMFGITQPNKGIHRPLMCGRMPKMSKGPAPDELLQLRDALAANLRVHMNIKFPELSETAAAERIGRDSGVGRNTVLRAIGKGSDDSDVRLDTVVKLAIYFKVSTLDLLRDYGKPRTVQPSRPRTGHALARAEGSLSEADRAPLQRHRRA